MGEMSDGRVSISGLYLLLSSPLFSLMSTTPPLYDPEERMVDSGSCSLVNMLP